MAAKRTPAPGRSASVEGARLLDTTGVARLLDIHPKHVFRLLKRGLPGHRLGGGPWRFDADEVLRWVGTQPARPASVANAIAPPLLAANGDVCIELLLAELRASLSFTFGFVQADATSGRAHLVRGRVLAAGVHGTQQRPADAGLLRVHLARRSVGLAFRPELKLRSLRELAGLRLASRGATAGVRAHLDQALREEGLAPGKLHRSALICDSHRDVVLSLVSGRADVGLVSVAWAARVGLGCLPIADEDYGVELHERELSSAAGQALLRALESRGLKRALARAGGYDTAAMGERRA